MPLCLVTIMIIIILGGHHMPKMNVESFNLDHTKVVAPFVRLAGKM